MRSGSSSPNERTALAFPGRFRSDRQNLEKKSELGARARGNPVAPETLISCGDEAGDRAFGNLP